MAAAVLVLGVCLIIWPGISAGVLCNVAGAVLAVAGAVRIICYFQRGISVLWHRFELPLGLLDALLGVYFFSHPANVLLMLPVVMGIVILVDSVFKLQASLEMRRAGLARWWAVLVLSILSIVAAVFLIRNPFEGSLTLMVCLGIALVITGVQSLAFIHQAAKDIRRFAPVEVDYVEQ